MKAFQLHKVLAMLLVIALVCGLLPITPALAAEGAASIKLNGETRNSIQEAYDKANNGDTITISGTIELQTALKFNQSKNIKLVGEGTTIITIAEGSEANFTTSDEEKGKCSSLLVVGSGTETVIDFGRVTLENITFDAAQKCRCVYISGTDHSTFEITGCTFQEGQLTQGSAGGGLQVRDGAVGSIGGHTVFKNNVGDRSYTGGGGMYVGFGSQVCLDDVIFQNNEAHSGGALYVDALGTVPLSRFSPGGVGFAGLVF